MFQSNETDKDLKNFFRLFEGANSNVVVLTNFCISYNSMMKKKLMSCFELDTFSIYHELTILTFAIAYI